MIIFLLWLLGSIDGAFIGYRDAAGRNALIDKKGYYTKALLRGFFFAQIAMMIAGVLGLISISFSDDPQILASDFLRAGSRMLSIYIPFALVILLAFLFRMLPSVDIKSIMSTLIFGPFTLFRPIVAVSGLIYAFVASPRPLIFFQFCLMAILMLGMERFLGKLRAWRG